MKGGGRRFTQYEKSVTIDNVVVRGFGGQFLFAKGSCATRFNSDTARSPAPQKRKENTPQKRSKVGAGIICSQAVFLHRTAYAGVESFACERAG